MSKATHQRSQFIMLFFAFSFGMILSNLLGQAGQTSADEDNNQEVVMIYQGIDKVIDDLPEPIATEYRQLKEETEQKQKEMLYSVALEWELAAYAQEKQLPIEQAGEQLFDLSEPSEAEVNAFYVARADQIGKPFYEVKEKIYQHLVLQKAKEARYEKIAQLIETGDLALELN